MKELEQRKRGGRKGSKGKYRGGGEEENERGEGAEGEEICLICVDYSVHIK